MDMKRLLVKFETNFENLAKVSQFCNFRIHQLQHSVHTNLATLRVDVSDICHLISSGESSVTSSTISITDPKMKS